MTIAVHSVRVTVELEASVCCEVRFVQAVGARKKPMRNKSERRDSLDIVNARRIHIQCECSRCMPRLHIVARRRRRRASNPCKEQPGRIKHRALLQALLTCGCLTPQQSASATDRCAAHTRSQHLRKNGNCILVARIRHTSRAVRSCTLRQQVSRRFIALSSSPTICKESQSAKSCKSC